MAGARAGRGERESWRRTVGLLLLVQWPQPHDHVDVRSPHVHRCPRESSTNPPGGDPSRTLRGHSVYYVDSQPAQRHLPQRQPTHRHLPRLRLSDRRSSAGATDDLTVETSDVNMSVETSMRVAVTAVEVIEMRLIPTGEAR